MAVNISIEISREFTVAADLNKAFKLLANVPESASHFPRVDALVDLGDNRYRWEMKKIGIDKHSIQTIYACLYTSSLEEQKVQWSALKGEGNGLVEGSWNLSATESGTVCKFHTTCRLRLPLPSILKLAISPIVKHEFNALVDTYMINLQRALE